MAAGDSLGKQFDAAYHDAPKEINAAIDSYANRVGEQSDINDAPYDKASLAEIYHPRVRQLMDLQGQGFTHAKWGWDADRKENRWHGVAHPN